MLARISPILLLAAAAIARPEQKRDSTSNQLLLLPDKAHLGL